MADFLSRSLTTRRAKKADRVSSPPARAFSVRKPAGSGSGSSERVKISGPVNLISTTNMLSYHAPDIVPKGVRQATIDTYSSNASTRSTDESDHSSTSSRSRQVSTDASSLESAPTSPESHQARGFFDPPPRADRAKALHRSASTTSLSRPGISPRSSAESQAKKSLEPKRSVDNIRQQRDVAHRTPETIPEITPEVPRRHRSHSKEAHEFMARKRSVRSGQPPALSHSRNGSKHEQRSSFDMFKHGHSSSDVDPTHPFGRELEQLNEVVEELGTTIRDVALDEDTRHMRDKGLARFCAADYLAEIAPLAAKTYKTKVSTAPTPMNTTWI